MPGPLSTIRITSRPSPGSGARSSTRTGSPPWCSALPTRLATTTSSRRGSRRARTPSGSSVPTRPCQARAWSVLRIVSATSTSSRCSAAAPASNRETSMRSSTIRASLPVSWLISRTAEAVSGSRASASSSSTSVTAVIAASGVRSSCETSAANRRALASIRRRSATLSSSLAAMSLNVRDRSASSSAPLTSSRVSSLPSAIRPAACRSPRTGRSTPRAASSAGTTASPSTGRAPRCAALTSASTLASSARSGSWA